MPGGLITGCSSGLAGAASYFPCTAWLWPEDAIEEQRPILQAPTQNLAEALIPPYQLGINPNGESANDLRWNSNGNNASALEASPHSKARQKIKQGSRTDGAEGIELKTAASNPYLGQGHLQSRGKFVEAKPGRTPGVPNSANEETASWMEAEESFAM